MSFLEPLDRIRPLKVKLGNWLSKRRYGKEMTPMRVLYARRPFLMDLVVKIFGKDKKLELSEGFVELIRLHVATLNGCAFCQDISQAELSKKSNAFLARKRAIADHRTSEHFSEAEKRALEWVEKVVRDPEGLEELFPELRKHWSEEQLIDLTYIAASETYINMMNRSFGIGSDGLCELKDG